MAPSILGGVAAALGLARFQHLAQLRPLSAIDRIAHGVLGGGKTAGCQSGLHPLGGVWCEFDLHLAIRRITSPCCRAIRPLSIRFAKPRWAFRLTLQNVARLATSRARAFREANEKGLADQQGRTTR